MQSGKWILTSLVMTFGIPILAQFLAAVVAMLGPGLPLFLRFAIYSLRQQFIFYSTSLC